VNGSSLKPTYSLALHQAFGKGGSNQRSGIGLAVRRSIGPDLGLGGFGRLKQKILGGEDAALVQALREATDDFLGFPPRRRKSVEATLSLWKQIVAKSS
jgi:hypothetical protein